MTTDYPTILLIVVTYTIYRRLAMHYQKGDEIKWELAHRIINTVRAAAGVPFSENKNPYKTKSKEENNND